MGAIENSSVQSGLTIVIVTKHPVFPKGFAPFDGHRLLQSGSNKNFYFLPIAIPIRFLPRLQKPCTLEKLFFLHEIQIIGYFITRNNNKHS